MLGDKLHSQFTVQYGLAEKEQYLFFCFDGVEVQKEIEINVS